MRFKNLEGKLKGKAQREKYMLTVGLGGYKYKIRLVVKVMNNNLGLIMETHLLQLHDTTQYNWLLL